MLEIINPSDADIVFNPIQITGVFSLTMKENWVHFFITTTHEFIFDGWGDFNETNWMDNSKCLI